MVNRTFAVLLFAAAFGGAAYFLSSPVEAQGPTAIPSVWLQSAPDTNYQAGNINLAGRVYIKAGAPGSGFITVREGQTTGMYSRIETGIQGNAIYGDAYTETYPAVIGKANTPTNTGVWGIQQSTGAQGLLAWGPDAVVGEVSGAGRAGYFHNTTTAVELAGPNGGMYTNGFLHRQYDFDSRAAAIPIAYGSVGATGTVNGGSGNFTIGHTVTGEYEITVAGENYSSNTYVVNVNPIVNTAPYCATVADGGVSARISMWNLTSNLKADLGFHFTIWTADPAGPGDYGYKGPPKSNNGSGPPIVRVPQMPSPMHSVPK
jgi:hypothetical protein